MLVFLSLHLNRVCAVLQFKNCSKVWKRVWRHRSLVFCVPPKCFTVMRIPIAALPSANERIIAAGDVLFRLRTSCLRAALNESRGFS